MTHVVCISIYIYIRIYICNLSLYKYTCIYWHTYMQSLKMTVGLNSSVGEHALGYTNGGLPDFPHFHFDTRWAPFSLAFLVRISLGRFLNHWTKVTESAVVGGPMVLLPIFFWAGLLRHRQKYRMPLSDYLCWGFLTMESKKSRTKKESWDLGEKDDSVRPLSSATWPGFELEVFLCKTSTLMSSKCWEHCGHVSSLAVSKKLPPPELSRRSKGVIRGWSWKSQSRNKPEHWLVMKISQVTIKGAHGQAPAYLTSPLSGAGTQDWCREDKQLQHWIFAIPTQKHQVKLIHLEIGGKRFENPADFQVLHVLRRGKRLNWAPLEWKGAPLEWKGAAIERKCRMIFMTNI